MSVATLGLEISSAGLKQAPVDLDKLAASAAKAERAAESLGTSATGAFARTGTQATEMGRRIQEATKSASIATEQNGAIAAAAKRAGVSYSEMADRVANASRSAFASSGKFAEAQSVTKSKLYDLEKQQDKTSNSAGNLANTLTRRFILGYAVSQVKSLTGALVLLNNEVAKVGDLGNIIGTGSTLAQGLVSSAGYKGIQGESLASAMVAFNQQVPLAKAGVGSLGELLRKNGVTVSDTADAFFKVADMVKNASDGAARISILQQAGLPATIEMAKYLGQGADAIKAQSQESLKLSSQQIEAAQRIRDKWEENWQRFKDGGTFAIAWVIQKMQELGRAGDQAVQALNPKMLDVRINNAIADVNDYRQTAGAPDLQAGLRSRARTLVAEKPTIDAATEKAIAQDRISKAQQYLGLLGSTTTALEARRQVELQLQSAALNHVGIDSKRAETLKQLAYDQNLGLTAIRASADAYNIEAATVGMATGEAAKYAAVQNAINDARRNGRDLLPEQIELIKREADAMGQAAQRADDLKFKYDTFRGGMQDLGAAVRQYGLSWKAVGSAVDQALQRIQSRLIDMASQKLWEGALGKLFDGFNLGNLFGTGTGTATYTPGPQGLNGLLGHNANGTDNWRGGPTWVGEQGPEIVNLPKGASVTSNKKIASMIGAGGGSNVVFQPQIVVHNAPAGTEVKTSRGSNGQPRIDVMLKRAVDDQGAALISSGESAMGKALEQRYGLTARL